MSEASSKRKVGDLFPRKWVNGQSLPGPILAWLVGLEMATVHPRPGIEETAHVLRFEVLDPKTLKPTQLPGHERTTTGYGLILTRRLAEQIATAVETDILDEWPKRLIVLETATLNGKRVLIARKPRRLHKESDQPADRGVASNALDTAN